MRILICTPEYVNLGCDTRRGSGIARVVYEVSKELEKRGIKVDICSPEGPEIIISQTGIPGRVGLVIFWLKTMKILRSVRKEYDAVWLHNPILLRRYKNKNGLVAIIHSTSIGKIGRSRNPLFGLYIIFASLIELVSNFSINRSDIEVSCVSESVRDELYLVNPTKKRIIRNGSGFPILSQADRKGPKDSKTVRFLYVGRLDSIKNPQKIVKIFSEIERSMGDCHLEVIGNGPELADLKATSTDLSITYRGFIEHDHLLPYYDEADFFIMASIYEGCPLTLMDAINRGLRCIVPDIPSLRFVEDTGLGVCFDRNNIDLACEKILSYVRSNVDKEKTCVADYSWTKVVDSYVALFEKK
jgi:glycosyltransferase involved in cell wall biosynthesis